jgi:2-polyprenyl-3-methyl-5-hydroxy-6-metoxy-1,4-benzoquinol methylase
MDLLETPGATRRHPWEVSRARAVERIVRRSLSRPVKSILDWGCGDLYTGRFLLERLAAETLVGVDPHLTDAQRVSFAGNDSRIMLLREEREVPERRFDLLLLCDVIEHVDDDVALVEPLVRKLLADGGRVVVTVPAFQSLFSAHDVAVKHHRRYRLSQLESTLEQAGLAVLGSGYLFGSLLPARAISKLLSAIPSNNDGAIGLGAWRGGEFTSKAVEALLTLDNSVLLSLAERGVKPPGLSVWASCEKRSS